MATDAKRHSFPLGPSLVVVFGLALAYLVYEQRRLSQELDEVAARLNLGESARGGDLGRLRLNLRDLEDEVAALRVKDLVYFPPGALRRTPIATPPRPRRSSGFSGP